MMYTNIGLDSLWSERISSRYTVRSVWCQAVLCTRRKYTVWIIQNY